MVNQTVFKDVKPGDILAVRTRGFSGWLIRLGARLQHQSPLHDHIVVIHHVAPDGTVWGIEGNPSTVDWVAVTKYDNYALMSNAEQPKTTEQREFITRHAKLMLGTAYDWQAIAVDALAVTSIGRACVTLLQRWTWITDDFPNDLTPARVVCSSFAVWLYHHAGLAYPDQKGERWTTPADWTMWIKNRGWEIHPNGDVNVTL